MKVCGFIPVLIFSSYFSVCAKADEEVLCVYGEHCVLPCSFTPGSDPVIEWIKAENDLTVHSFRQGQTQKQYPDYSGRTSVFVEEINRGNASLLLRRVTIQDQGRFLCWADEQVTYVNMKVFAPVSEVHGVPMDALLVCWADDIFPKPNVTWTMDPEPSYEPKTSIVSSKTGLFSVYSSVPLPHNPPYHYSCNINTAYTWESKTYEEKSTVVPSWIWIVVFFILLVILVTCSFFPLKKLSESRADPIPEVKNLEPNCVEEAETEL